MEQIHNFFSFVFSVTFSRDQHSPLLAALQICWENNQKERFMQSLFMQKQSLTVLLCNPTHLFMLIQMYIYFPLCSSLILLKYILVMQCFVADEEKASLIIRAITQFYIGIIRFSAMAKQMH